MSSAKPPNEEQRLKALRRYDVLDTDPEKEFDDLTLLASHICGAPIAMMVRREEANCSRRSARTEARPHQHAKARSRTDEAISCVLLSMAGVKGRTKGHGSA